MYQQYAYYTLTQTHTQHSCIQTTKPGFALPPNITSRGISIEEAQTDTSAEDRNSAAVIYF